MTNSDFIQSVIAGVIVFALAPFSILIVIAAIAADYWKRV